VNTEPLQFFDYFSDLKDPRIENRNKRYSLHHLLILVILGVICGADSWVEIEAFGKAKKDFFKTRFGLNRIPSHDTLGDLFARLNPAQLQKCFLSWIGSVMQVSKGEIIAIDGKTLRGSYQKGGERQGAIHMVSAWASRSRLVLGQRKVDDKSNEITAIPELLKVLDIQGCTVTIDAMGCQQQIATQIRQQGGDYVLAVKENQGKLHSKLVYLFNEAKKIEWKAMWYRRHETLDGDHGRIETRRYTVLPVMYLPQFKSKWKDLKNVVMVESIRMHKSKEKMEADTRYYITSLPADAKLIGEAIRRHWSIENNLHWSLDVAFREDESRVRRGNAAENLAVIRHIALNLLKQESSAKVGIKIKRSKAGWDESYLAKVLAIGGN